MEQATFSDLVELIKSNKFNWEGSTIVCKKKWNKESVQTIQHLQDTGEAIEIRQNGKLNSSINTEVIAEVSISLPRGSGAFIAKDISDLLSNNYIHSLPSLYYLLDEKINQTSTNKIANKIKFSRAIINALTQHNLLEADRAARQFVVHTHKGKVAIPFNEDASFLETLTPTPSTLQAITDLLSDNTHLNEKEKIVRSLIYEYVRNFEPKQRLLQLISNSGEILSNAQANYDIFVTQFSFQDEKEKLYEQKRVFSEKMNSVLSGIQTKLITIPISAIIANGQFKDFADPAADEVNFAIFSALLIFTLIITWLIASQLHALSSIEKEISAKHRRFRIEVPRINGEVEDIFKSLKASCRINSAIAATVLISAIFLFQYTTHIYYENTPSAFQSLAPLFKIIFPLFDKIIGLYNHAAFFIPADTTAKPSYLESSVFSVHRPLCTSLART